MDGRKWFRDLEVRFQFCLNTFFPTKPARQTVHHFDLNHSDLTVTSSHPGPIVETEQVGSVGTVHVPWDLLGTSLGPPWDVPHREGGNFQPPRANSADCVEAGQLSDEQREEPQQQLVKTVI